MTGERLFWLSAAGALLLQAIVLLAGESLQGGGDLRPHLRLVQLMGEDPALRSVYAPAYHALGALVAPLTGLAAYPRLFAFLSAAALIAGFRALQRAAGLPDLASAVFAWSPYLFALSWCRPKVEAAGYALAFTALALLLRRRYAALAVALAGTFLVHTGAALFLGLTGGVLALARRDARALVALAAGSAAAAPLFGAHLAAGCSLAQALLFSQGDYLRSGARLASFGQWDTIAVLCGPIATGLALAGARPLWREHRDVALLCIAATVLYLNEVWLAPFDARTTLDLLRGLTVLALPVAAAAGVALAARPAIAARVVAATAVWAVAAALWVVPDSCFTRVHDVAHITATDVDRCTFRWKDSSANPDRAVRGEP